MNDPSATTDGDLRAAVAYLSRAVEHLEVAVAERDRRAAEDARELDQARAEAAALRALQHTIGTRLDGAIGRLRSMVGD